MRQVGVVLVVVSLGACSIESPKPEMFEGGGLVVRANGSVELSDVVPRVDPASCPAGHVLSRTASGWACVELALNDLSRAQLTCQPGDIVQRDASGWICAPIRTTTVTQTSTDGIARITAGPGIVVDVTGRDVRVSVDFGTDSSGADTVARSNHTHAVEQEVRDARGHEASLLARIEALEKQIASEGGVVVDPDCPTGYTQSATVTTFTLCTKGSDQMVRVGDMWIDRYEATIFDGAAWNEGQCDGNGNSYGIAERNIPADFAQNGNWTAPLYACSRAGTVPTRYVTWFQATQACALSGKHLPSMALWQTAVGGTIDPGANDGTLDTRCHTQGSGPRAVGAGTGCASRYGAEDLIGNLWEWVGMWSMEPGYNNTPTLWPTDGYNDDGYYRGGEVVGPPVRTDGSHENSDEFNIRHLPSAVILGGGFGDGTSAGAFTVGMGYAASYRGDAVGFRCALRR